MATLTAVSAAIILFCVSSLSLKIFFRISVWAATAPVRVGSVCCASILPMMATAMHRLMIRNLIDSFFFPAFLDILPDDTDQVHVGWHSGNVSDIV